MFYRHAPVGRVSILARNNTTAGIKRVTLATVCEALLDDLMNSRKVLFVLFFQKLINLIQYNKYVSRSDSVYVVSGIVT